MLKRWIVAQHSCQKWISRGATGVETRSVQAYRLVQFSKVFKHVFDLNFGFEMQQQMQQFE